MTVAELIEELLGCNPDAIVNGYVDEEPVAVSMVDNNFMGGLRVDLNLVGR